MGTGPQPAVYANSTIGANIELGCKSRIQPSCVVMTNSTENSILFAACKVKFLETVPKCM